MNDNNNNNGMILYKESFITKFKNFFKRIFNRQKDQYMSKEITNNMLFENSRNQDAFLTDIKVDAKTVLAAVEKENFLREIDGNAEALTMLSMDRLLTLEKYYDDVIKQNVQKIKKLKEAV